MGSIGKLAIVLSFMMIAAHEKASAQDTSGQTPENAQAFLTRVVAAGGVRVWGRLGQHDYGVGEYFATWAGTYLFPRGTVLSSSASSVLEGDSCFTLLTASGKLGASRQNPDGGSVQVYNPMWIFFRPSDAVDPMDPRFSQMTATGVGTINWSRVPGIVISGPTISIPITDTYTPTSVRLVFPSDDLATRVGFAMEIIRLACDPTADANF